MFLTDKKLSFYNKTNANICLDVSLFLSQFIIKSYNFMAVCKNSFFCTTAAPPIFNPLKNWSSFYSSKIFHNMPLNLLKCLEVKRKRTKWLVQLFIGFY